jgi:hypothetical protein
MYAYARSWATVDQHSATRVSIGRALNTTTLMPHSQ